MSKFVKTTKHPSEDLHLTCYTKKAFYNKKWDSETINARGHVYDGNGNLVSCPFPKFFNIDEHPSTERAKVVRLMQRHWDEVLIHQKWNGHLCILFNHQGEWINTTKGSFNHDFVELDRLLLETSGYTSEVLDHINEDYTLMFEAVADYDPHLMTSNHTEQIGCEHAVLIGVVDRTTGKDAVDGVDRVRDAFRLAGEAEPYIPSHKRAFTKYPSRTEVESYLDFLKGATDTEGVIIHIPSIDYRVKVKTTWFMKERYKFQFNADKTRIIFKKYEDTEAAFEKIPEEFHSYYQEVLDDYFKFVSTYKESIMELLEKICPYYLTKEEIKNYVNNNPDITPVSRAAIIAFVYNSGFGVALKDVFIDSYASFSLVDRVNKAQ